MCTLLDVFCLSRRVIKSINMGDCGLRALFADMYSAGAEAKFDEADVKLKHPFSLVLAGASGSGKTRLMKDIILNSRRIIEPAIEHIIWFYTSEQHDVFNEIAKTLGNDRVEFVRGLPVDASIEEKYIMGRHGPKLVIIDDLMSEANTRQDVNHLFTRGRHLDTSLAFLVQNFHNKGKYMRENTLNADYIVLFKNPRDMTMIQYLGRQMRKEKFLQEAFEKVTRNKPYTYLFIDLRSDTLDILRFRSAIMQRYSKVLLEKV